MSAVIYNLDETYDLELQVFKFAQDYSTVKFFSVRAPRLAGLGFAPQIAQNMAYDVFEGYAALWGADAPKAFILRVGNVTPSADWLSALALAFPEAIRVIVTDDLKGLDGPAPGYLEIRHSDAFFSSVRQDSRFFALMAIHDFVISDAITNLGNGNFRIARVPSLSLYDQPLSLQVELDIASSPGTSVKTLPSQDRLSQLANVRHTVRGWLDGENTTWQAGIIALREYAWGLYEKAESFHSKQPSRLGTFSEIAETDQADLSAAGGIDEKLLTIVLTSKKVLCEITSPPLMISGFRSGKPDYPNSYQRYLRDSRMRFIPVLQAYLSAAERLVGNVSTERRERLRAYEAQEIRYLNDELTGKGRCDPRQLSSTVDELKTSAHQIEQRLAEIDAEQDNEHLFGTDDVDVSAIHSDYLSSFRAAARLASSYWLIATLIAIVGLASIPVIERLNHNSASYFPYDVVYLVTLATVTAMCFFLFAWLIRSQVKKRSSLYAATLWSQFQRKDLALCQFFRYLLLSTALRRVTLILNALETALAHQKTTIKLASQIDGLISQVGIDTPSSAATQWLLPDQWENQLIHATSTPGKSSPGICQLKIRSREKEIAIVQFPCFLFEKQQAPVIIGEIQNAAPH